MLLNLFAIILKNQVKAKAILENDMKKKSLITKQSNFSKFERAYKGLKRQPDSHIRDYFFEIMLNQTLILKFANWSVFYNYFSYESIKSS